MSALNERQAAFNTCYDAAASKPISYLSNQAEQYRPSIALLSCLLQVGLSLPLVDMLFCSNSRLWGEKDRVSNGSAYRQ